MKQIPWNKSLIVAAAISAFAAASASVWFSHRIVVGLAAGSTLMIANLIVLKWASSRMTAGRALSAVFTTTVIVGKFAALLGVAWLALSFLPMEPLAFGLGIVLVPLSLAAGFSLTGGVSEEAV